MTPLVDATNDSAQRDGHRQQPRNPPNVQSQRCGLQCAQSIPAIIKGKDRCRAYAASRMKIPPSTMLSLLTPCNIATTESSPSKSVKPPKDHRRGSRSPAQPHRRCPASPRPAKPRSPASPRDIVKKSAKPPLPYHVKYKPKILDDPFSTFTQNGPIQLIG